MRRHRYNPDALPPDAEGDTEEVVAEDLFIEKLLAQGYQEVALLASDGPAVVEATPQDDADPSLGYDYGDGDGDEYAEYDDRQNPASLLSDLAETNPGIGSNGYSINVERFTDVPKFGLNPQNQYNTPTGLYWYDSEVEHADFGTERKYVLRAQLKGVGVDLGQLCPSEEIKWKTRFALPVIDRLVQQIENVLGVSVSVDEVLVDSASFLKRTVERFLEVKARKEGLTAAEARVLSRKRLSGKEWVELCGPAHTAALWWAVTRKAAQELAESQKRDAVNAWTTVFRSLGIEFVVDPGFGVIHPSEPEQVVSFSIKVVHNRNISENVKARYGTDTPPNVFRFVPQRPVLNDNGRKLPLPSIEYLIIDRVTRTFEKKLVLSGQKLVLSILVEVGFKAKTKVLDVEYTVGPIFPDAVMMQTPIGRVTTDGTILSEFSEFDLPYRNFWLVGKGAALSLISPASSEEASAPNLPTLVLGAVVSPVNQAGPLANCNLSDLDLAEVQFVSTNMRGSVFDNACLDGALFENARITDCSFRGASLLNTTFHHLRISGADFTGADLRLSKIAMIPVVSSLETAFAEETSFQDADMRGVREFGDFWRRLPDVLTTDAAHRVLVAEEPPEYPHFFQGTDLRMTFFGSSSDSQGLAKFRQAERGETLREGYGALVSTFDELGWKEGISRYRAFREIEGEVYAALIRKALLRVPSEKLTEVQATLLEAQQAKEARAKDKKAKKKALKTAPPAKKKVTKKATAKKPPAKPPAKKPPKKVTKKKVTKKVTGA